MNVIDSIKVRAVVEKRGENRPLGRPTRRLENTIKMVLMEMGWEVMN
jgi:hypothetical protein